MTNLSETYANITKDVEALVQRYAENDQRQVTRLIIRAAMLQLPEADRAQTTDSLRIEFGGGQR